jgi:hypothetical protein
MEDMPVSPNLLALSEVRVAWKSSAARRSSAQTDFLEMIPLAADFGRKLQKPRLLSQFKVSKIEPDE